jgi:predicted membrane-bound spermidine synthase
MPLHRSLVLLVRVLVTLFTSSFALAQQDPAPRGAACGTENLIAGKAPWQTRGNASETASVTDGTIGVEGARWDSPFAARLDGHRAALIYDLGEPRRIEAVYLQADANDTYKVMGSLDGSPSSFRLLVELPTASDRGHGLRARSTRITPSTVRYLMIGDAVGDDAYSISEFAAYCSTPKPFPPAFPSTGTSLTPPKGFSASEVDEARDPRSTQTTFLIAAAVLAFVGAIGAFERERRRKPKPAEPETRGKVKRKKRRPEGAPRTSDAADERRRDPSEEPSVAPAEETPSGVSLHRLLCVLFVASGAAALIYEVIWMHLLRLVIGASALSVGIVLASFMGGMFLGSLLFARFVPANHPPLRVYALLEIGIGVFGLLMPLILPLVRYLYVGLVGYGTLGIAFRALIAMVLLLPPTALMGATLPAIARRYAGGHRAMSGLAALYASNTLGAVLGSLLAAFYLMAVWDVWIATLCAAALNFAVGAVAYRYARQTPAPAPAAAAPAEAAGSRATAVRAVYVAAALSGLTALGAQVVWTRLLTLLFGATVYAFAIILAVFLFSLGAGSALAAYLLRRRKSAFDSLAWTQLALIPCLLWAGFLLARVLPLASPPALMPIRALHVLHLLRAFEVIFPAAFLWGMSFPFALAAAAQRTTDPGRSSGYVYAANTVGAIVGALAVSFWIIPAFGTHWAERVIVLISGISAAFLFYLAPRLSPPVRPEPAEKASAARRLTRRAHKPVRLSPAWALAACAAAAAVLPGPSTAFLAHGRYIWWVDPKDQYPYVHEGASCSD